MEELRKVALLGEPQAKSRLVRRPRRSAFGELLSTLGTGDGGNITLNIFESLRCSKQTMIKGKPRLCDSPEFLNICKRAQFDRLELT